MSHVDWAADINSSEGRGGLNRVSVYSSRANTTVLAAPTVQTTDLPGKWQYSRCLACVYIAYIRCRCSRFIRSSVNLRLIMCSRTVSSSQTITRLKTAFLNAQPLDTPPRVWNLVKSAVCNPLPCGRALSLRLQKHTLHLGCGDVSDITNNGGKTAAESDCATACSGDPLHLCGGTSMLQLYLWNGTFNTWDTPANIGRYEVFTFSLPVCTYGAEGSST